MDYDENDVGEEVSDDDEMEEGEEEEDDEDEEDEESESEEESGGADAYGGDALAALAGGGAVGGGALGGGVVSGGFAWSDFKAAAPKAAPPAASGASASEEKVSRKGKRARDKEAGLEAEAAIARREAELADAEGNPQSADDYERLIVGSPNSSYVWVRYMAFLLGLTEIEKARALGARALKTIELGEHTERFNIHAALLNLEKAHGDERSLSEALTKALQGCDPKRVYMHVASMHERAKDFTLADGAHEVCCRKYRSQPDVWLAWITARMQRGEPAEAKQTLQRAVDVLPQAKHVEVLSKFAQLEFKFGTAERGRTVFDGILSSYPKRVDIWSVYLDMELKNAEHEPTKRLFERATSLRLSSKKMKFLFGRYLTYARGLDDAGLITHVKEKAKAWVASAVSMAEVD